MQQLVSGVAMPSEGQLWTAGLLALSLLVLYAARWLSSKPVYLVDLHCFNPPERYRVSREKHIDGARSCGIWSKESMDFSEQLILASGVQDTCFVSDGIVRIGVSADPSPITLDECMDETRMVLFDCADHLLAKTGVQPKEVDAVIVACSCFAPTPSMAAMLVNYLKLREDVLTYNLSGMGCSASVVCLDLAASLLKANPGFRVLIFNHENVSRNLYRGAEREMLVANCLFRLGGAAVLLSNRRQDAWRAKYRLQHIVRTHLGSNDEAFHVMGSREDAKGNLGVYLSQGVRAVAVQGLKRIREDAKGNPGVYLSQGVRAVAVQGLKRNLSRLGRAALPLHMKIKYLMDRKVPAFNKAFQHFLVHTGSRGVLDALQGEPLHMSAEQVQPARQTLCKFGNTSSSSTWYVLAALEQQGRIKRGDRLWQLVFGAGFKCNSAVWVARRSVQQDHECWATM